MTLQKLDIHGASSPGRYFSLGCIYLYIKCHYRAVFQQGKSLQSMTTDDTKASYLIYIGRPKLAFPVLFNLHKDKSSTLHPV